MALAIQSGKYVKFFIYLVILVLINIAGITLFFRLDLTQNRIYSLSEVSKKVVGTLSEPLIINVFFTKNLPAPHNYTEQYLHDLLEEYAVHANRHFRYHFYDVNPDGAGATRGRTDNQQLADTYGIHPLQIQVVEEDAVKFKKAYMGLVLIHGDIIERIPTITTTDGLEYKLTTSIQKLNNKVSALLNLKDQIRINLYLSSSLKQVAPQMGIKELSQYPVRLEEIVKKLNQKFYDKLAYAYLDPTVDESIQKQQQKYKIMRLNWPSLSNGEIPAGEGVIGLVMEYGEKIVEMPLLEVIRIPIIGTQYNLAELDSMEEMIDSGIERLIDINEDLGYLSDHGTLSIAGSSPMGRQDPNAATSFSNLVSQTYTLKPISLKDGPIPESLNTLVIARPTEPFSDYELFQIDQALMRGTRLTIFLDAFKEVRQGQSSMGFGQGPAFLPLNTGLEKLLNHYGIRIKRSLVLDENSYKQPLSRQFGGGEQTLYFAPIIKNKQINPSIDFMKNIKGLIVLKISPLELNADQIAKNSITALRLFSSSTRSWEMSERINLNPMFMRPPSSDQELSSMPLAYLLEGEFVSYFAGKAVPEKTVKKDDAKEPNDPNTETDSDDQKKVKAEVDLSQIDEKTVVLEKGKPSRILLVGSGEMIKDSLVDSEGQSMNSVFLMNAIDYMNDRGDVAVMRGKEQRFNPLYDTGATVKTFIKMVNIAGLPVLVVLFGLFVWLFRLRRKKQIQTMFIRHTT
jgi:ABC-2 type transport system permease protein